MSNTTKWIVGVVVVVLVVVGVVSATGDEGDQTTNLDEPVKVGAILPLTGPASSWAEEVQRGIQLAAEEVGKENVEVIYEDSQDQVSQGVSAFKKLNNTNDIDSVITALTSVSSAVCPLANDAKILQFGVATWGTSYRSPDDYTFRVDMNVEDAAESLVSHIENKNYSEVGVIYSQEAFSEDFQQAFKEEFEGSLFFEEGFSPPDKRDFRTLLTKLKAQESQGADSAVFIASPCGATIGEIVKQARELGIQSDFVSLSTVQDDSFYDVAGEAGNGLVYVYPYKSNNPQAQSLTEKYQQRFGEKPQNEYYVGAGYEALRTMMRGYKKCESNNNECVKDALYAMKPFETIFGEVKFDKYGEISFRPELRVIENQESKVLSQ
ncbi:MAG: ABC transporter substrate-binding protein [Candidatus Magasanikbacteria bacterium]